MRVIGALFVAGLLGWSGASRGTIEGSCEGFQFSLRDGPRIDDSRPYRVLRMGAPVFDSPGGTRILETLVFDAKVAPVEQAGTGNNGRIRVKTYGSGKAPAGWMNRADLLCQQNPLLVKGIERKLFVRTAPVQAGENPVLVRAYAAPSGDVCPSDQKCQLLSRFRSYLIYAQDSGNGRVLVASSVNLSEPSHPLVGWIATSEGIQWNTSLGLRPTEVTSPSGARRTVRAFPSRSDSQNNSEGIVFLGGREWYRFTERIPVLDMQEGWYKVAYPAVGIRAFTDGVATNQRMDRVEGLGNIDVLFLLDGTQSMDPSVRQVRDVVTRTVALLGTDPRFQGIKFRFGFHVYRDLYSHAPDGVDPGGLPLGPQCQCSEADANSGRGFLRALDSYATIPIPRGTRDGFPEALFAGLRMSFRSLATCAGHMKLLFIIGDAGDNNPSIPEELRRPRPGVIPFFVQTPHSPGQHFTSDQLAGYNRAYQRFSTQAEGILRAMLTGTVAGRTVNPMENMLRLDQDARLADAIFRRITDYTRGDLIAELKEALRGGTPLETFILQHTANAPPVIWWNLLRERLCSENSVSCNVQINDMVADGWLRVSDDVKEEVIIRREDLLKWVEVLGAFEVRGRGEKHRPADQREALLDQLGNTLQTVLGTAIDRRQRLEEVLRRNPSLPMRNGSPLLQYSLGELAALEECELNRLVQWVMSCRTLLNNLASNPTRRTGVEFVLDSTGCELSPKGRRIPIAKIGAQVDLCPEAERCSHEHRFFEEQRVWVPVEYLP